MPETQTTRRLHWLLWMLLAWAGVIFMRLVWLQVIHHDDLLRAAQQQQQRYVEVQATRGAILDRSGQPLAKSLPAESICVNPQKIPDAEVAADLLSRVLDLDHAKLLEKIQEASRRRSGFLWIKRKVSAEEAARVRSLKLDWVEFRPEMRRFYPHGTLAAHVLGSVGMVSDESVERGTAGIEAKFEDDLAGTPGLARVFTDVKQNPYDSVVAREPDPGANITLTIDPNLQYDAEKELAKAIDSSGAKTGSVVAVNPANGDILAMANYPTYDPNQLPTPGDPPIARSNIAVSTPFEPGSVFKVITLSAALETTHLRPNSIINCGNGSINLFGRVIHDEHRYSQLSMADVLAKSSNIGAIQIGLKTGEHALYKYQRGYGFGRKTGIDLPGESAGMLRRVEDWMPSSIGSLAMGHEVSVTSIQLALAGAVVANGGLLVKPRIVLARQKPGHAEERFPVEKPQRVIAPETAILMRQMMEGVVLHGTGKRAILKGYTSAGKTGSAQIYDVKTHTYTHHYNASFLGFAPVANPQIVIVVTLEGTTGGTAGFGGPVAAPVFREVAMSALRMLDVPKDLPDSLVAASRGETVDEDDLAIAGLSRPPGDAPDDEPAQKALKNAHDADAVRPNVAVAHNADAVRPNVSVAHNADAVRSSLLPAHNADAVRSRSVSSVTPPPVPADSPAPAGESSASRRPFLAGPKVPDFHGMTLRAVFEESAARGLKVEVLGNGLARAQDPPPGTILPAGASVRVQFAR